MAAFVDAAVRTAPPLVLLPFMGAIARIKPAG